MDELEYIHPVDIRNALRINDRIWDSFIDDYEVSEVNAVLQWINTNQCIYQTMEDSFGKDDMASFIEVLSSFSAKAVQNTFWNFFREWMDNDQ